MLLRSLRCLSLLLAGAVLVVPARAALASKGQRIPSRPRTAWFSSPKKSTPGAVARGIPAGHPAQNSLTVLTSGVPQSFDLPAVNGPTLFDEVGYRIDVPAGSGRLQVSLVLENYENVDADLFVRYGSPIT
jgi:hypothetical protein